MIRLTLPYPPSANRYWRFNRGRIHRSAEADQYIRTVAMMARGHRMLEGEIRIVANVYRSAKRGDLDNCGKVLIDSLRKIIYADDSQIQKMTFERFEDKKNPRVEIELEQVNP